MKKIFVATVALAVMLILTSSVQAVIKIETATVQNGVAFIKGNGAVKSAPISWEGIPVTTANKTNGGFSFFGVLPADCIGALSDGGTPQDVQVLGCTPVSEGGGVLKTGQTQCETSNVMGGCPGNPAGQDGELQKGTARSYTVNGDGTITDDATGLMWEKLTDDGSIHDKDNTYNWDNAFLVKIADLNTAPCFAGQCDWRLPNVNELQTLADYGRFNPAIDPAFNNGLDSFTRSSVYWSSTTSAGSPGLAWGVIFADGFVRAIGMSNFGFVRAVRGGS